MSVGVSTAAIHMLELGRACVQKLESQVVGFACLLGSGLPRVLLFFTV